MPRPYHTPKSERDEKAGALAEAEQRPAVIRFNVIFTDGEDKTTEWDFHAPNSSEASRKVQAEVSLQNDAVRFHRGGYYPELGEIVKIDLYDFQAQEWLDITVPAA